MADHRSMVWKSDIAGVMLGAVLTSPSSNSGSIFVDNEGALHIDFDSSWR